MGHLACCTVAVTDAKYAGVNSVLTRIVVQSLSTRDVIIDADGSWFGYDRLPDMIEYRDAVG